MFYLTAHGTGDGLWRLQDGRVSEIWKAAAGALAEPPAVSPDGRHVAIVLTKEWKRHVTIVSADGGEPRSISSSINVQGAVDWEPNGSSIVAGGRDSQGRGLFQIPVDGGAPVRLADGAATNPVWSPDGTLIVYTGPVVAGQRQLLGVRPDRTAVKLPTIQIDATIIRQGHRFLPNGKGLVYVQSVGKSGPSREFWLLDLATKITHKLAHLSNQAEMRSFDITPDGKQIDFDRTRENADIVLIELPK